MHTSTQLTLLHPSIECSHSERTISTDNMDKFCQAICDFSNDISVSGKNCYLIIGLNDNCTLHGLKIDKKLLLKIYNNSNDMKLQFERTQYKYSRVCVKLITSFFNYTLEYSNLKTIKISRSITGISAK